MLRNFLSQITGLGVFSIVAWKQYFIKSGAGGNCKGIFKCTFYISMMFSLFFCNLSTLFQQIISKRLYYSTYFNNTNCFSHLTSNCVKAIIS